MLRNLRRFYEETEEGKLTLVLAIPEHARIPSGLSQVSDKLQSTASTNIVEGMGDTFGFGGEGNRQWTVKWDLLPVTDRSELERLRVLYGYAVAHELNASDAKSALAFALEVPDAADLTAYLKRVFPKPKAPAPPAGKELDPDVQSYFRRIVQNRNRNKR